MRKIQIALQAQTILTLDAGSHDGVQDENGDVYVKLQSITVGDDQPAEKAAPVKEKAAAPAKAAPAAKAAPSVADDTKKAAPAPRTRAAAAPAAAAPEAEEKVLIPEDDWGTLNEGDAAYAKLNMEGEDGEKFWDVTIIGWKKPKGSKEDKLYVKFEEDGAEDYLREGDELYEFSTEL